MSDAPTGPAERPRIRVPAGTSNDRLGNLTIDSVANFVARLGITQPNLLSGGTYTFNPVTRLAQLMEWAYRGSWIVGAAVDVIADDMTRAGVQMNSETEPEELEELTTAMNDLMVWQQLNDAIKWARLYGGAVLVMEIDGQDMATELIADRIRPGQLKGFLVLDRWMVQTTFNDLVMDYGPDYGMPRYYDVIATAPFMPRQRIHYTRCIRIDGVSLPFRQRLAENGWGMSVIERLYDRLMAFDSGTLGASQLLFKAYLRTYKVKGLRTLMGSNGELQERFFRQMDAMRLLQSTEGLSVIDGDDEFETHAYSFAGIPETLLMLGQQLSGALGIPLVRLFGQSPSGMNATGESDFRQYDYLINATQESRLRRPLTRLFHVLWRSVLGRPPPRNWNFTFNSIRTLDEMEKAEIAQRDADTVKLMHDSGIITTSIALKELKQSSIVTGRFTNITDQDIKDAEAAPPPWEQPDLGTGGANGGGGLLGAGVPQPKAGPGEETGAKVVKLATAA